MKNHFKISVFFLLIISLFTIPSSAQYCVQDKMSGITTALGLQICRNTAAESLHVVYTKAINGPSAVCPVAADTLCRVTTGHGDCSTGYFQCKKPGNVLIPTAVDIYQEQKNLTSQIYIGYACYDQALIDAYYP